MQYDPKYYEEPRKFKPERYSESQTANKGFDEMSNLVFGGGPRNCLGNISENYPLEKFLLIMFMNFRYAFGIVAIKNGAHLTTAKVQIWTGRTA